MKLVNITKFLMGLTFGSLNEQVIKYGWLECIIVCCSTTVPTSCKIAKIIIFIILCFIPPPLPPFTYLHLPFTVFTVANAVK